MIWEVIRSAFSEGSKGWIVVIVVLVMVGPTGIEKAFDRFFPPTSQELVDNTEGLPFLIAKLSLSNSMMVREIQTLSEEVKRLRLATTQDQAALRSQEAE